MSFAPEGSDLLMWVGSGHYPSIKSFVTEAETRGVCKRVPQLPTNISPGKTRVFLAHDEGNKGSGHIFGFFVLTATELIVEDAEKEAAIKAHAKQSVSVVTTSEAALEDERGCGMRSAGVYLVANIDPDNFEFLWSLAKMLGPDAANLAGPLITFARPINYNQTVERKAKRFRSYRWLDGDWLIDKATDLGRQVTRPHRYLQSRQIRFGQGRLL